MAAKRLRGRALRSGGHALGIVEAVVDVLTEHRVAPDDRSQDLLVQLISDDLGRDLVIPDQAVPRLHLIQIVAECLSTTRSALALTRAVGLMRPDAYVPVRRLLEEPSVLDVVPEAEVDWLRQRLAGVTISRLRIMVRRAAGPSAMPAWRGADAEVGGALTYLQDVNAGEDGLPALMRFAESVAEQVGGELGGELAAWNDRLARRFNLGRELGEVRRAGLSALVTDGPLHLVVAIRHDGIDPGRYLMSYWRQDDPDEWPPACGGTRTVVQDEIERAVDELVTDSEIAWANREFAVSLEFILPRSLLNLPVHLWHKDYQSGDPRPLCLDYPIVVRSLERMQNAQWHRVWRRRWQTLMDDPGSARVHFAGPPDTDGQHRLDALLLDLHWTLLVLSSPPPADAKSGSDELTAALRSGLPTLMWADENGSEDSLRTAVSWLAEDNGLSDLPARVQAVRQATFLPESTGIDRNVARSLVVLWDDPHRLVALD